MIHYFTPYSLEKNLGKAYNHYMSLIGEDDWACLVDGDVMFLTSDFGKQISDIVNRNPETGIFTCLTNRIKNAQQLYNGKISNNPDILYHKKIADDLKKKYSVQVRPLKKIISGHVMVISKKTWNKYKFIEKGILAVDNHYSERILKAGLKIHLMKGLYVFHYYRFAEGSKYKKHLL